MQLCESNYSLGKKLNNKFGQFAIETLLCLQMKQQISDEYEQVKDITKILASFKQDSHKAYNNYDNYNAYGAEDYSRHEEPTRDPDVWPPPTPVEYK
jgi:hypothetical protein